MIIAVDFDGTIVDHVFPEIGDLVPGALETLKEFSSRGYTLILWTMRSGKYLDDATNFCKRHGIKIVFANHNPGDRKWTDSPKVYANVYIDDAALGCPLKKNPRMGGRPYVDWELVRAKFYRLASYDLNMDPKVVSQNKD